MRIVFAGHTGLEKETVVGNLINHIKNTRGSLREEFVKKFELEKVVEEQTRQSHVTLLETSNLAYVDLLWTNAFNYVFTKIERDEPEHVFLNMHLTFHVPGRSPMPYLIEHLRRFETTHIITLIDDIYEVQARIERFNTEHHTDFHITLRELAWWGAHG